MKEILEKITKEPTINGMYISGRKININELAQVLSDMDKRIKEDKNFQDEVNSDIHRRIVELEKLANGYIHPDPQPTQEECKKCGLLKSTIEECDPTECNHELDLNKEYFKENILKAVGIGNTAPIEEKCKICGGDTFTGKDRKKIHGKYLGKELTSLADSFIGEWQIKHSIELPFEAYVELKHYIKNNDRYKKIIR